MSNPNNSRVSRSSGLVNYSVEDIPDESATANGNDTEDISQDQNRNAEITSESLGPGRLRGVMKTVPIIYGTRSELLTKKLEDGRTHQWVVFLDSYFQEDLSRFVKKVHFKLHESYDDSVRIVTKPPYQVQETGWGEFEIIIKIFFEDPNERPVTTYHLLKLFHTDPEDKKSNKPVVSIHYDEIIFDEPTPFMRDLLQSGESALVKPDWVEYDFDKMKKDTEEKLTKDSSNINRNLKEKIRLLKLTQDVSERLKSRLGISKMNINNKKSLLSKKPHIKIGNVKSGIPKKKMRVSALGCNAAAHLRRSVFRGQMANRI